MINKNLQLILLFEWYAYKHQYCKFQTSKIMCGGAKRRMVENSCLSENGHPSKDFYYIYKDLKHCAYSE